MSNINMEIIKGIESSGNPLAFNKKSKARGLYQITPIVLKEWGNFNPKEVYSEQQLFDADINTRIADWYMNNRIPQMLKAYKLSDTPENRLASYNAGIGYLTKKKPLPLETQNYIKKYLAQQQGGHNAGEESRRKNTGRK